MFPGTSLIFLVVSSSFAAMATAAGSNNMIELNLGVQQNSEDSSRRVLTPGETLQVIINNHHEADVLLPAPDSGCAVISVKQRGNKMWKTFSSCQGQARAGSPLLLKSGQSFEGKRTFGSIRSVTTPEVSGSVRELESRTSQETTNRPMSQPPGSEVEVQQLITEAPQRVAIFENFRSLPIGDYRLETRYAFSGQPEEIYIARSATFSVVDYDETRD